MAVRVRAFLFPLPDQVTVKHAHGTVIDESGTILITYEDKADDSKCLLRWNSSKYNMLPELLGPGKDLCRGVPHGLRAAFDDDGEMILYHANNEQSLHKITFDGDIIWSQSEKPIPDQDSYNPTWFAARRRNLGSALHAP